MLQPIAAQRTLGKNGHFYRLNGEPPPLRSTSGQPLHVYGRHLIRMTLDGVPVCFYFYVCDVPYPVISVARLLLQGYKVNVDSPDTCTLRTPDAQEARVIRQGSLLFLCSEPEPFNEYDFAPLCNEFHAQFKSEVPAGLPATLNPVYHHADRWVLKDNMLIRLHPRARKTFFVPNGTQDRSVPVEDLASRRVTDMELADGTKRTFTDNWRTSDDPCARVDAFKGRTILLSEFKAHRKSFVDENFHFATPTAAQQQRQRDGKMSTLLRDRQGHFRLKTRFSLPSWTRQKKERWRTLSLLSYKQFLTWTL